MARTPSLSPSPVVPIPSKTLWRVHDKVELVDYGLKAEDLYDLLSYNSNGDAQFSDAGTTIVFEGVKTLVGIEDSFTFVA